MQKAWITLILITASSNGLDYTNSSSSNKPTPIATDTYLGFIDWIICSYSVNRVQAKAIASRLGVRHYYELDEAKRKQLSQAAHTMQTAKLKIIRK